MTEIDGLITVMTKQNAERAILVSDKPAQIVVGGQKIDGAVLSGTQVERMIAEIIPNHLRAQLAQSRRFQFPYQSPNGIFNIVIYRPDGILQVAIEAALEDAAQQYQRPVANYGFPPTPVPNGLHQNSVSKAYPLTPDLKSFNWGAFFLPLFWCISHNAWGYVALLAGAVAVGMFVPPFGVFVVIAANIVIGLGANEVGWESREWNGITDFEEVQAMWKYWGVGTFILGLLYASWVVNKG